jgi:predicted enzyme related to lactoylglutathione lyase
MAEDSSSIGRNGLPVAFVYVGDRDRALAFYRDVLGARLHDSDDYGDFLAVNGALVRLTVLPDYEPGPHPVLGWEVDDIVAVAKALESRGTALSRFEGMGQDELGITTSPDGGKMAFFADPDGNALMLTQMSGG